VELTVAPELLQALQQGRVVLDVRVGGQPVAPTVDGYSGAAPRPIPATAPIQGEGGARASGSIRDHY